MQCKCQFKCACCLKCFCFAQIFSVYLWRYDDKILKTNSTIERINENHDSVYGLSGLSKLAQRLIELT